MSFCNRIHQAAKTTILFTTLYLLSGCDGTIIIPVADEPDIIVNDPTDTSDTSVIDPILTPDPDPVAPITYTPMTTPTKIFLTTDRIEKITTAYNTNHEMWTYFVGRLDRYVDSIPYNSSEYAAGYALAFRLTGNAVYRAKAIELFWLAYRNWDYTSRNGFRHSNQWAHYTYDWLQETLTQAEKDEATALFRVWADYWLAYINIEDNFAGYRVSDSDETTSLSENLLLLAISLEDDSVYSTRLFAASDSMLANHVVGTFMNGVMAGGMWGEGTDYSPATMQHWIRQFVINKEHRGISYPTTYMDDVIDGMWHSTYPGFTGMFEYGDLEGSPTDYSLTTHEYRDSLMITLINAVESPTKKALAQHWLNRARAIDGGPPAQSSYTGMWRVLFEALDTSVSMTPVAANLDTSFYAPGIELVSFRDSWNDDASVVYLQNSKSNVDHQHFDALSFNIISDGVAITKEMTGYAGVANSSTAHNTLLIENGSTDGGSSPTGRPAGVGSVDTISSNDNYGFVEADATNLYNMSGYYAENYADQVNRKLFFLKPNKVIVHDSIVINDAVTPRWKKYIQHFQTQPVLSNGTYSSTSEGKTFYLKPLLPTNRNTTVVDQSVLWSGHSESTSPVNQRRWHISISPSVDSSAVDFLNFMYFGDEAAALAPVSSAVTETNDNFTGTYIEENSTETVVMFNKRSISVSGLSYNINSSYNNTHYITGLAPNSNFTVNTTKAGLVLTTSISTSGSTTANVSNNEGILILSFDTNGNSL